MSVEQDLSEFEEYFAWHPDNPRPIPLGQVKAFKLRQAQERVISEWCRKHRKQRDHLIEDDLVKIRATKQWKELT